MIWLLFGWIFYFFLHSFFADLRVKRFSREKIPAIFPFYRLAYNGFSIAGLAMLIYFQISLPHQYFLQHPLLPIVGITVSFIGSLIIVISLFHYDLPEFFGFKQLKKDASTIKLNTQGLNRYVRHPLYFGQILLFLGLLLLMPTTLNAMTVAIIFSYIYIGARLEEKKLIQEFGEEYSLYRKKAKMLVPYIF